MVVQPRRPHDRVGILGLLVGRQERFHLALHVLRRNELQQRTVRAHDVVPVDLPVTVNHGPVEHPAELVTRLVGLLGPGDRGVQFSNERQRQRPAGVHRGHQEVERIELGVDHRQCVLGDAALAGGNLAGDSFGNQGLGDAPVDVVEALDDAGLDRVTS